MNSHKVKDILTMTMQTINKDMHVEHDKIHEKDLSFFSEAYFNRTLSRERKRSERSGKSFMLMLIDVSCIGGEVHNNRSLARLKDELSISVRETDVVGWYRADTVFGVIFTEVDSDDEKVVSKLIRKMRDVLRHAIGQESIAKIRISFHIFPEKKGEGNSNVRFNLKLYPDLLGQEPSEKIPLLIKRGIDIIGSLAALIFLSPIFLLISAAIKMTSPGPILFKQERVGYRGEPFTFLKFRSMYINGGENPHREYITKFINGSKSGDTWAVKEGDKEVYKLKNDSRVTPLGRFLRKYSLDELPQFINVLKGDMSLVGPRPPISYECDLYDIWHRKRLLQMRPGITGLWQVTARSSASFDDMVRLDVQYLREWSLWKDIIILLRTPWVVIAGKGAY